MENKKREGSRGERTKKEAAKKSAPALRARDRVEQLPLTPCGEIKRVSLKPGGLTAPLPPVIVSVGDGERSNLITIGWTGILATHPPKTYISVRPSRYSHEILKANGEFVINLPTVAMARAVDFVGVYTGRKLDKAERTGLTLIDSECVKAPTVAEAPLSIECRVTDVMSMGTHDVFVADVVGVSARGDIIDGEGKLRFDRADLLAYAHGEYYSLGERLGAFGFSTAKKSSAKKKAPPRAKK